MDAAPLILSSSVDAAAITLQNLPNAVLVLHSNDAVEYANGAAQNLFKALNPVGSTLRTLFTLNGLVGGGEVLAAVAARTSVSTRLPDGRVFDLSSRSLPDGGVVVTLVDVSRYVHDAERATRDTLTGLLNRASFHELLREKLAHAQRTGEAIAVLCIDLDRFKSVNDTLGHPVGDGLLAKVGERLRSMSRETDFVARLGGDEFAILQTGGDQPLAAQAMATRLVDLIGRTYVVDGHMLNIGASVGIALAPGDGSDPDTLLKRADLALYKAKVDGRGTFRFFEGEMDARMQARRAMEINIRKAMALKELELAYQPQVHLETSEVVGFEALLRWNSAERGIVSPADFIPLAEEIGLIVPIGDWVLRTACHEAASWSRPVSIAVNLSPVQFRNAKLIESVVSALASSGLDPTRLELEITEGALLENTERVLSALNALRALGVRISMDDFGTGYSSLSYLQKFPFDKIKIDQSFVRGNTDDSNAIVRAVAGLGASLGIKTTAEGVETVEQLNRIRAQGCHEVQGYFTGRPMAGTAAASLLNAIPSH
ncbi:MAG: putative bifunctional diguanylate cyclase/phosphodiesterase [Janthinobacterium lividum]